MSDPCQISRDPTAHSNERAPAFLHGFFELAVREGAGFPAVVGEDEVVIPYEELDSRANRLAHHLRASGVEPEVRVGIACDPGVEMLVAMFGILKAGGAYVPIDPAAPTARIRMLVKESGAHLVLTSGSAADGWSDFPCPIFRLDQSAKLLASQSSEKPEVPDLVPENLAYVIFTSGSTGKPKGVMIPHSGIAAVLAWRLKGFPFTPDDRVLQTLSFTFDASLWQFFHTLGTGASLVFLTPEERRDPNRIIERVAGAGVSILGVPPSVWKLLLSHPGLGDCQRLRMGFCGGEPLTEEVRDLFFERLSIPLHNVYGPTETSMEATSWTGLPENPRSAITIGLPVSCAHVRILDADLAEVPEGEEGELFIGGAGVGRGYLNDPALTAQRFLPDPFLGSGARIYRTGDRARQLSDGSFAFVGREDEQIKLHGHRIELGEIDSTLAGILGVTESIVLLREDRPGDQRLVGYAALDQKNFGDDAASEVRVALGEKLPAYMVPRIVVVDALPRNANGKVERASLPIPGEEVRGKSDAPGDDGPLEIFLRELWEEVLGTGGFGNADSFFDVGGNSIHVAMLIHKMQERLGEFVYTVALYDAPTISALADYLRANYTGAVARIFGAEALRDWMGSERRTPVDETKIEEFQNLVRKLPPRNSLPNGEPKNPTAVFALSPPRSGSTLLRIMLGGHPKLFSPPELQLLNYNTLAERKEILDTERDRFWLEGTVRAIMEIRGCPAEEAERLMAEAEEEGLSVKAFYRRLQEWLGESIFTEKTPTYPLDPATLQRAEEDFEDAKYIHLIRHPSPMISSFDEAKLHVFFPPFLDGSHNLSVTEMAELVWYVCHRNILKFLESIPGERQHRVRFEDLVKQPEVEMRRVAKFLDLPFHPDMANPYTEKKQDRMTDAIHPLARMLGDVKFHSHGKIRKEAAERKQGRFPEELLGEPTRALANQLGYDIQPPKSRPVSLMKLQPKGKRRPLFCVHAAGGTVSGYRELSHLLGENQPFYAFRSGELDEGQEIRYRSVEELASEYIEELTTIQPDGPYQLGGWSFGGIVAMEMAIQLRNQGKEVAALVLIDSFLPEISKEGGYSGGMRDFLGDFTYQYGIQIDPEKLAKSRRDRLAQVWDLALESGAFPKGLSLEEFRRIYGRHLVVFRNHVRAGRCYLPGKSPPRFVLFEAEDHSASMRGPTRDWAEISTNMEKVKIPGNHFTILQSPGVDILSGKLSSLLKGLPNEEGADVR